MHMHVCISTDLILPAHESEFRYLSTIMAPRRPQKSRKSPHRYTIPEKMCDIILCTDPKMMKIERESGERMRMRPYMNARI